MNEQPHLLYIEADDSHACILQRVLQKRSRLTVDRVSTLTDGLDRLLTANHPYDAILAALGLPDAADRLETVRRLHQANGTVPLVILTGLDDEQTAITALRYGAQDYIVKENLREEGLFRSIRYAIERMAHDSFERALHIMKEQVESARGVQQMQFPKQAPELPGFDVAGQCQPASSCGGDYFDFFPLADGRQAVVLGDVTGHGLGPAMLAASVRSVLRTLSRTHSDVGRIVQLANEVVRCDGWKEQFMTLALCSLDPATGEGTFSGAGHDAVLLNPHGIVRRRFPAGNLPIGIVDGFESVAQNFRLHPGEMIVIVTDGIQETSNEEESLWGRERMMNGITRSRKSTASEMIREAFEAARSFAGNVRQQDDMTAVCIRRLDT